MVLDLTRTLCACFVLFLSLTVMAEELAPQNVSGTKTITPAQAKELFENEVLFVDVRGNQDFDAGRIPGAIHLSLKGALSEDALLEELDKDNEVVFYCNGEKCKLSSEACAKAVSWGFTNVYYFREGMPGWINAGYPVE